LTFLGVSVLIFSLFQLAANFKLFPRKLKFPKPAQTWPCAQKFLKNYRGAAHRDNGLAQTGETVQSPGGNLNFVWARPAPGVLGLGRRMV
jgi:hypothetical protein